MSERFGAPLVTVRAAEAWEDVNQALGDFADGTVREVAMVSGDYVDPDRVTNFGDRPVLLAFVQLQAEPYSAVLAFRGIRRFEHEADRDVSPGRAARVDAECWQAELLGLRVIAEMCELFVTGESGLGSGLLLASETTGL